MYRTTIINDGQTPLNRWVKYHTPYFVDYNAAYYPSLSRRTLRLHWFSSKEPNTPAPVPYVPDDPISRWIINRCNDIPASIFNTVTISQRVSRLLYRRFNRCRTNIHN